MLMILLCFSSKGLPSSSTYTLEEGTIYLTSEPNALEMQDDNASVLDVYLVSNSSFFPFPSGLRMDPGHSLHKNRFGEARPAGVLKETVALRHFHPWCVFS